MVALCAAGLTSRFNWSTFRGDFREVSMSVDLRKRVDLRKYAVAVHSEGCEPWGMTMPKSEALNHAHREWRWLFWRASRRHSPYLIAHELYSGSGREYGTFHRRTFRLVNSHGRGLMVRSIALQVHG